MTIHIERKADPEFLDEIGVFSWPIWEAEISEFPWHYDTPESCYFLDGVVTVIPERGEPIKINQGDYVTFPAGLSCHWKISSPVKKHYRIG